jgi:V8-like Glu-specific endopeptidase
MRIDQYQLDAARERFNARATERQRNRLRIAQGDLLHVDDPRRVELFLTRRGFSPAEARELLAAPRPGVAAACETAAGVVEPFALERVLGTSDLMGVAFLERGLEVARTVGRILVDAAGGQPRGYGTGFLVSRHLLLTNHHVLGDPGVAARSLLELDYQLDVDGQPRPTALFALDRAALHLASRELDFALVAVQPIARDGQRSLAEFGWNRLIAEEGKAIVGQWVNIVQHPDGGLKQLALRENLLVDVLEEFLHYQTDTAPGSSGSPVLNDRWEVVALHHAGVWARDAAGRILAVDGRPWTQDMGEDRIRWIANEGARISRVLRRVRAMMPVGTAGTLVEEMLAAAPPPPRPPSGSGPAAEAPARPEMTVAPDGTATWTIPLSISVRVGAPAAPAPASALPPAPTPASAPAQVAAAGVAVPAKGPEGVLAAARRELGSRGDVAEVRLGYVFRDGWITRQRALVVTVPRRLSPRELREVGRTSLPERFGGLPVEVTEPRLADLLRATAAVPTLVERLGADEAGLGEEIVYEPPAGAPLTPVTGEMRVLAHVSPDHAWPVLRDFLGRTRRRLVVGMFDVGAPHVVDALAGLAERNGFEGLTLVIQRGSNEGSGTKADDLPDEEVVERLRAALGERFEQVWVKLGSVRGWVASSYHVKVAVRDRRAFWLSSGNWQSSNQPDADPLAERPPNPDWLRRYNREWHAVVEHAGLAATFERYLRHDFERNRELAGAEEALAAPDLLLPAEAVRVSRAAEAEAEVRYFDPFDEKRRFTVTPLLTPDNFHAEALRLVQGAEEQLLIQNQTFNAPRDGQDRLRELVEAVLERQRAGLDVRIVFRLFRAADARANLEALLDLGFDPDRIKVQPNCHTKAVIVDGRRVMLGSQNWSGDGVSLNRDASLLFDDAPLAAYFREIFEHDWTNLAVQDIGREGFGTELAEAGEPTPAGMARLTWKDYAELA